jgi:phage tail sheath protein FI
MAEYLSPAVYIEEKSSGIKPIEGVGTSTAAFVGHAEKGPIGEAVPINNFSEFQKTFGGYIDEFLAFAVKGFFDEGGTTCYVVRTCHYVANEPTAVASFNRISGIRNGLSTGSKLTGTSGFAEFLFDSPRGNAIYLVSYNSGTRELTLTNGEGTTDTAPALLPGAIPAGDTETAVFSTFGATIVLDENFSKDPPDDIAIAPDTVSITDGSAVIDATSIKITDSSGDITGITSTTLTFGNLNDTATLGEISITVDGFSSTFDGSTVGDKTVVLGDANGNTLEIEFHLDSVFDGDETAASIVLHELENLVVAWAPLRIEAKSPGTWGDDIAVAITHNGDLFNLAVSFKGDNVESFNDLTMDKSQLDYVETRIHGISNYITVTDQVPIDSSLDPAHRRPAEATTPVNLVGGNNGLSGLISTDYTGDQSLGSGFYAFDKIDGISILAVPDAVDRDVHIGGMTYCENRKDCFYIADSQESIDTADNVLNYKLSQGDYSGGNAINSKYGALYTPWISVFDPRNGGRIEIPPSGAVAGIYARTDGTRGVHKVAAGITDGKLRTALDVVKDFTDADQAKLNPKGINVIRKKKGIGNVAWGARTVSSDPEWRYLNVRRLFIFLEKSIENATKWVVFEPNDKALWKSITRNITAFLRIQWRAGALVGSTEEEAFYVKCDEETNPPESIDLGRVITEIGVAPSKPAEFVIFRIAQWQGGSEVSE